MIQVRELEEGDRPFLGEMLYAALDWRQDGELPPIGRVLAHPQAVIFHERWGRPGDTGLVAEEGGRPIGAVWCRLFTESEHGEGWFGYEEFEPGDGNGRLILDLR